MKHGALNITSESYALEEVRSSGMRRVKGEGGGSFLSVACTKAEVLPHHL